jgi:hypothetical protein
MKNRRIYNFKLYIILIAFISISFGFISDDKRGNKASKKSYSQNLYKINQSGKQGDAYRLNINNLNVPLNNVGTIADVNIPPDGTLGRFGNSSFLFSSGFFISGETNGTLWASAQATASLIENFVAGPVNSPNDPNALMYVLNKDDEPFGLSWQDWRDAVALGADFYDGDGDGLYDPVDKNGNGVWDPESSPGAADGEDHPDLIGDETVWCVYNDGQPAAQRLRFAGVQPQGIEIRQTVFAFASKGALGNIMFIRYRFLNTGLRADTLHNVYFGVWADADLGDHLDDLAGVDVSRDAGFTYNDGPDVQYGNNPPCYMIDFFSGPLAYVPGVSFTDNNLNGVYDEGVDTPIDTGYSNRGQIIGVTEYPGATNLGISSFVHYIQSDPNIGDPSTEFEARNYMLGLNRIGEEIDPCNFANGQVRGGVDCNTVDNKFWFSGDPVTNTGWINTTVTDQRQMQNTGPFKLVKGEELEITVAYIVGQGTDALSSISAARDIDDGAQFVYSQNFAAPSAAPNVTPVVEAGEDFIDLTWSTTPQVTYKNQTVAWDLRFEGYNLYAYRTNSTQPLINGQENSKLLTSFDLNNIIKDIYKENGNTGGIELLYSESDSANQLDYQTFADPETGRIKLKITQDPFTGGKLIKGKPYYFAITSYALNYNGLINKSGGAFGDTADYYLSAAAFVGEVENVPKIINDDGRNGIFVGDDLYNPPVDPSTPFHVGASDGNVKYIIVNKEQLTGNEYTASFIEDRNLPLNATYQPYWSLTNNTTGDVLIDSSKVYNYDTTSYAGRVIEGFLVKVKPLTPAYSTSYEYTPEENAWYQAFAPTEGRGVFYVGRDVPQGNSVVNFPNARSTVISADRLRNVELRFGTPGSGKAYRFLNGYIGANPIVQRSSYQFAGGVTESDTVGKGPVVALGNGFIDVPFTAWVADEKYNEEYQLAVGIVESRVSFGGHPDAIWDPDTSLTQTKEIIIIFDAPYNPTGNQIEYTGGEFTTTSGPVTVWGDITKPLIIPADAQGITAEQRSIAESPWRDAMYVVGFQRDKADPTDFYVPGDVFEIPMAEYPYTSADKFTFVTRPGGSLTEAEEKALFDKVTVFPNPLYGYNVGTSYSNSPADEPFVTFSNLPEDVTIKIYSLAGNLLRSLNTSDKSSVTSPFIRWDLQNESGLRVASGMYLAIVSSPLYGEKVLKFAVIMPQKQIQKF